MIRRQVGSRQWLVAFFEEQFPPAPYVVSRAEHIQVVLYAEARVRNIMRPLCSALQKDEFDAGR